MSDKDPIKDLFRDKLQSHEVMPSKAVWSNVSSSLGHSAASASSIGTSSILKIAAVVVGVSTVGVVIVVVAMQEHWEELGAQAQAELQLLPLVPVAHTLVRANRY